MSKPTNCQGFSLIELLFSFSLIIFFILGTAQLLIHSLFITARTHSSLASTELVSEKLEHFKSLPFESNILKEGSYSQTLYQSYPGRVFILKWDIRDLSSELKQIEIEAYSKIHPEKKIRLVLYISQPLGF